jgi:hypothetical protein
MDQPQQPANEDQVLRPLAADFDRDPERFAANQLVTQKFAILGDVHDQVADRSPRSQGVRFSILAGERLPWTSSQVS